MKKYLLLAVALILVGAMLVGCVAEPTSVLEKIQKAKKVVGRDFCRLPAL